MDKSNDVAVDLPGNCIELLRGGTLLRLLPKQAHRWRHGLGAINKRLGTGSGIVTANGVAMAQVTSLHQNLTSMQARLLYHARLVYLRRAMSFR